MAKTTDVAGGQQIIAPWGNEIRDKTVQQFANVTELNGWAAPDGSVAKKMDTNELWHRIKGGWYGQPLVYVVTSTVSTDVFGNFGVTVPITGAKTIGGFCVGTQVQFPKYFTINSTDVAIGGQGLLFSCRQTTDNTPTANSVIGVSATIFFYVP